MTDHLPLKNIRVIEMSHMVMGPACGMILAQLGADVIKVEPLKGDKTRDLKGMGTSFFPLFNRGKRSVVIDMNGQEGLETFLKLLETADVFIENFRDGQLEKQGINRAMLREKFPKLIIAGHKGFLSGPYEHRPALDEVVQMMSGLAVMTGTQDEPKRVGSSANDIMGGMFGVIGILAAIIERKETAKGKEVRIGLFENCLFLVAQHMVQFELTGKPSVPMSQREHTWPIYDIFKTSDNKQIFIAVVTSGHWRDFCKKYDLQEFIDDPRLQEATSRISARHWTVPIVSSKIKQHSLADLVIALDKLNIPFSCINRPEDMFDDPHVLREGGLVTSLNVDGQPFRSPTLPIEFDGAGFVETLNVPNLGAHTREVMDELKMVSGGVND